MAMEINSPGRRPKRLHRHAVPVAMLAVALLALSAMILNGYDSEGLNSGKAISRGLVTRVLRVRPTPNSLAEITLSGSSPSGTETGSDSRINLDQIGRSAQLSLNLQAPADNK